jgi:DNA-binding PadR family transcriptional regulator
MQEAMLALVVKEPAHGYELYQRLTKALGVSGEAVSPAQVYVTLSRLERGGMLCRTDEQNGRRRSGDERQVSRADRKVYKATAEGHARVAAWLSDVSWSRVAPVDFHLKLVAAALTGLADPIALIDAERRELLRQLGQIQRATPTASEGLADLLLEGAVLRLQADIAWLELCERRWVGSPR